MHFALTRPKVGTIAPILGRESLRLNSRPLRVEGTDRGYLDRGLRSTSHDCSPVAWRSPGHSPKSSCWGPRINPLPQHWGEWVSPVSCRKSPTVTPQLSPVCAARTAHPPPVGAPGRILPADPRLLSCPKRKRGSPASAGWRTGLAGQKTEKRRVRERRALIGWGGSECCKFSFARRTRPTEGRGERSGWASTPINPPAGEDYGSGHPPQLGEDPTSQGCCCEKTGGTSIK